MTELVANISRAGFTGFGSFTQTASATYRRLQVHTISRDIIILGLIVTLLQIMDGVLTGIGIHRYGVEAEGNLFIRTLMEQFGYVQALILVKGFSIFVIGTLCVLSTVVHWVPRAMKIVIAIYLCGAIIPWTAVLITRSL
jgi:hypothetical protein